MIILLCVKRYETLVSALFENDPLGKGAEFSLCGKFTTEVVERTFLTAVDFKLSISSSSLSEEYSDSS